MNGYCKKLVLTSNIIYCIKYEFKTKCNTDAYYVSNFCSLLLQSIRPMIYTIHLNSNFGNPVSAYISVHMWKKWTINCFIYWQVTDGKSFCSILLKEADNGRRTVPVISTTTKNAGADTVTRRRDAPPLSAL